MANYLYSLLRVLSRLFEHLGIRLKTTALTRYTAGRHLIDLFLWPSDLLKILTSYNMAFGRLPNLIRPMTFNEKLQRAKLFDRKRLYTVLANKIAVRHYVSSLIGDQYLTKLYWTGSNLQEAMNYDLPKSFIIKSNNGSGTNIIVRDRSIFDWNLASVITEQWLANDHSIHFAEWQYRWIAPMLLIEELLTCEDGKVPVDYKFFCFKGKVRIVQVDFDRFTAHSRLLFNRAFEPLPVTLQYPKYTGTADKPFNYSLLVRLAETLAGTSNFLRIDFYDVGRPVFGEITLHPGAAIEKFDPIEYDKRLGRFLR